MRLSALSVASIHSIRPEGGGARVNLRSIREGLRFVRDQRIVASTFLVDLDAMVFGLPRALFPALADEVFGGGARTVGLLFAAPGAGALMGALLSGWLSHVRSPGATVLAAVAIWGGAITAFGLTSSLGLALTLLSIAGAADLFSTVLRNTILQTVVPDRLRGRLSAIHIAVVTGGPRLGDVEAGAVAAVSTLRISVVSGGMACLAGLVVLVRLFPELVRWRSAGLASGGRGGCHAVRDGAGPLVERSAPHETDVVEAKARSACGPGR